MGGMGGSSYLPPLSASVGCRLTLLLTKPSYNASPLHAVLVITETISDRATNSFIKSIVSKFRSPIVAENEYRSSLDWHDLVHLSFEDKQGVFRCRE